MKRVAGRGRRRVPHRRLLLGLGLDGEDGHTRVTRGEQFVVLGGSRDTHEVLQEHCVKFKEELRQRRRNLDEISLEEARDISDKIGVPPRS